MMEGMSRIDLQLPTLQNWNCHNCSGCCRQHGIYITEEERQRIESQNWTADDGVPADRPLIVSARRSGPRPYRLAQQPDGACVFLDERGLCRIHGKFGEDAKPLACRIYPYAFHPAGERIAVSLRFSCPSVVANRGEPVARQRKEIRKIAEQVVPPNYRATPPPRITGKVQLDWPDTLRIIDRLDATFADDNATIAVKLLRALFWIDLIDQTQFERIRGERLDELLDLLMEAAAVEVAAGLPENKPSKIGMSQFRLLAGQYARQDTFASAQRGWRGRWQMLRFAWKLASGTGMLPALNDELREVPFTALQGPVAVPEASQELFTRYYRVKLQGIHFCGRAFYDIPLVEGFYSLAMVLPTTLWIARWRAVSSGQEKVGPEDVAYALTLVDHQHGYSDALGTWNARRRILNLARMGDLPKLITQFGGS
jgi:lysine-N-methylase